MANPRAAAPGSQPVQVDNVREKSWAKPAGEDLIGQIFFATKDATLDSENEAVLDALAQQYAHDMILNPTVKYSFFYFGYADHRADGQDKANLELSRRRAEAVETRMANALATSPNYLRFTQGMGIDLNDPGKSESSKTLAIHRRVDILGPKLHGLPPPEPPPPQPSAPKPKLSRTWQARMKKGVNGASAGVFQVDRFAVDIVDLENNLVLEFTYTGGGLGKSAAPAGLTYAAQPSEWKSFSTEESTELADFEGFSFHSAILVHIAPLPSFTGDLLILRMDHTLRFHSTIYLTFHDFTMLDPNLGAGAAQTGGTFQPTDGYGYPRSWNPSDP